MTALLSSLLPGLVAIAMWNRRMLQRLLVASAYLPLGLAGLSALGLMTFCDLNASVCVH